MSSPEVCGPTRGLTGIRRQRAIYFCLHRGSLPENTTGRQPRFRAAKPAREVVGYIPVMCDWCAGAGSCVGLVVSARTRIGSTSELLAQETSAITTTESAETRIIDFFMAGTVVDAAGQFNRRTP